MSQPPPLPPTQYPASQPYPPYPYQPPGAPLNYAGYQPCPGCGSGPVEDPKFTWWGGLIGHRILGIHKCRACRKWWVKKTGQPGGTRVMIYVVAGVVVGLLVAILAILGTTV